MNTRTIARGLLGVGLALGFASASWYLLATAPQSERARPQPQTPVVETIEVVPASHRITVIAHGTLQPAEAIELRSEVAGRIRTIHPDLAPGGLIPAGETIVEIDPGDYAIAVAAAQAAVAKTQAAMNIEMGRRRVAEEDVRVLQGSLELDSQARDLALRRPQLAQARADLEAARQQLAHAELDLARTRMSLPYAAVVLERHRVANEVVGAREALANLANAETYWLDLPLPPHQLARIQARTPHHPGAAVQVRYADAEYTGEVVRVRADLAQQSRLGSVIVALPDPLARTPANHGRPPLLIGSYVEASVHAGTITDAVRIPQRALRANHQVLVADAGDRIQVRDVRILWELEQDVLLAPDFPPGDRVVVSRSQGLVAGSKVRVRQLDTPAPAPQ